MYFLVIQNLGNKVCIDSRSTDIYSNGMQVNCLKNIHLPDNAVFVRKIKVQCTQYSPGITTNADVYKKP